MRLCPTTLAFKFRFFASSAIRSTFMAMTNPVISISGCFSNSDTSVPFSFLVFVFRIKISFFAQNLTMASFCVWITFCRE